ncbi:MAG: MmgE/PrpD family protein [Candidatus Acidiferrales bacterium]
MDDTTRQIVRYVSSCSESILTGPVTDALGNIMVDAMAALVAGFESEPARICARLAQSTRSDLKSTVLGYGVTTSPELAAFANGCMLRYADFNDEALGAGAGHGSDIISGILAIGEAFHSTGTQVMVAVALGYEIIGALADARPGIGWDSWYEGPAAAMAVGKLLGLNEDQLANALSLALVPHMPMSVRGDHFSHWKGCHSSEAVRCAVWANLLVREGMTGPSQPFEAKHGVFDHNVPFRKELRLPEASADGLMNVQRVGFKRFPAVDSAQSILEVIPQIRAWTRVDDIESIHVEVPLDVLEGSADPAKWDPRNPETADHSQPYIIARALIDGKIYLDSFAPQKLTDLGAKRLMEKITVASNPSFNTGDALLTVRRRGEPPVRQFTAPHGAGTFETPMSHEEVVAKFNRVCAFRSVADAQRDRARETWANLKAVRDIAEPMRALAKFGRPLPL